MDRRDVDWSAVSTAYGPATDVPVLLERLHAPEAAARQEAISDLWSCLCHQETVYDASAVAAPFLFDAARDARTSASERDQLLALLAHIGRGGDTCWQGCTSWTVVQDCASAVEALLPRLFSWAAAGDPEARRWAVVLATHFPPTVRALGQDPAEFLHDPALARLVRLLVEEEEPDPSFVREVAAREEDTLDLLDNGLDEHLPARQGREVVLDLAVNGAF